MSEQTGYLAPTGFVEELCAELGEVTEIYGRLVLAPGPPRQVAWAQNVWYAPQQQKIRSISHGAQILRAHQRNWACYSFQLYRRARLLQEKLPYLSARPLSFPSPLPQSPLGSWTLLERDCLLFSPRCSSPFPHGEAHFVEKKEAPPTRAYLKLWEALTRLQRFPQPGERCLDLGSSPGGWSWVLQQLGAEVTSIDKAPLAPPIAQLPRLLFRQQSAFALDPFAQESFDWVVCDVICYPARLLRLVQRWLEAGTCRRFLCTLKFQGKTDLAVVQDFTSIPGSCLCHLFHNKHELTWYWEEEKRTEETEKRI